MPLLTSTILLTPPVGKHAHVIHVQKVQKHSGVAFLYKIVGVPAGKQMHALHVQKVHTPIECVEVSAIQLV